MKKVLTIAGSDCSGGAGIQADLKTMSAHGVFAMSVIVSVVAENTARVIAIEDISPKMIADQMDAVFEDIFPDAVKVGMLSSPVCMQTVAHKLRQYQPKHIVIDPVMYAKNGCPLMAPDAVGALIEFVLPLATVLTPNIPEAECIAQMEIHNVADMEQAAQKIYAMGCQNVLVKGGHAIGNALDVLFDGKTFHHFETERIDTKNTLLPLRPILHLDMRRMKRFSGQRTMSPREFVIRWLWARVVDRSITSTHSFRKRRCDEPDKSYKKTRPCRAVDCGGSRRRDVLDSAGGCKVLSGTAYGECHGCDFAGTDLCHRFCFYGISDS